MQVPAQIGRFRVQGLVGEGAMGVVFRGRDESLDRDVALKVMRSGSADAADKERFLREARAVARLQHPNIVTIYELGQHEGSPFIAMELLEGVDLQRAIEGGLRPNPRATLPIVLQLLAGLGHAHEHGIVHRDVKPSNLFLPRGRPAKIMDFGVARLGGTSVGGDDALMGTPNYMSPEQVTARPVDGRSDLFSAALIHYEHVTGEKAYQGESIVTLVYKIAHEDPDLGLIPRGAQWERLRDVLVRGLAKDPDQRYPTASAMAADLALALQDLGGSIDGAAASDKGVFKRSAFTTPAGPRTPSGGSLSAPDAETRVAAASSGPGVVPAARTAPPPTATPAPAATAASVAAASGRRWMVTAAAGFVLLAAAAAAVIAMLVWRPGTGATASPRAHGDESLVSSAARLETPSPVPDRTASSSPSAIRSSPVSASPRPKPSVAPATAASTASTGEPPPSDAEPSAATARLDRAADLYAKGRYAAALAEVRAVIRREPTSREARALAEKVEADLVVETRLREARDAMRRGDRESALAQVRSGLAVKSTDARLLALFKELTQ